MQPTCSALPCFTSSTHAELVRRAVVESNLVGNTGVLLAHHAGDALVVLRETPSLLKREQLAELLEARRDLERAAIILASLLRRWGAR